MASEAKLEAQVILRDIMESTYQDYSKCALCYNDLSETKVGNAHAFNEEIHVFDRKLKIIDALDDLIDVRKKLHLTSVFLDECRLTLCEKCFSIFGDLYSLFVVFLNTAKDASFLHSILKYSRMLKRFCEPQEAQSSVKEEKDPLSEVKIIKTSQDLSLNGFFQDDHIGSICFSSEEESLSKDEGAFGAGHSDSWNACENSLQANQTDDHEDSVIEFETQCSNSATLDDSFVEGKEEVDPRTKNSPRKPRVGSNEKRYKCKVCSAMFSRSYHLTRHMHSHSEGRYRCKICRERFQTKEKLEDHQDAHVREAESREGADECSSGRRTRARRTRFRFESDDTDDVTSDDSDTEGEHRSRRNLRPARTKRKRVRVIAGTEGENTSGAEELRSDKKEPKSASSAPKPKYDRNAKRYQCTICSEKFSRNFHLIRHLKCHTDATFNCSICQAGFRTQLRLEEHVRRHDPNYVREKAPPKPPVEKRPPNPDTRLFRNIPEGAECLVCGKVMPDRHNVYSHIASHRGDSEKTMICELCGKTFKTSTSLKHHMFTHEDTREFLCNECGMAFKRRHHLAEHIEVRHRVAERKYVCPEPNCGKAFTRKRNLRKHRVLHTGTKFPCEYGCGALFTCKFNRRVHQETSCKNMPENAPRREKRVRKSKPENNLSDSNSASVPPSSTTVTEQPSTLPIATEQSVPPPYAGFPFSLL